MSKNVIIIGSGYGGLALANLLAKAGYTVNVYEKNENAGGRAGVVKKDGFTFDTGPSWYLMPEVFEQYYNIFNLSAEEELDIIKLTPGYRVFFESKPPITIQGDINKDAETFNAIEPGSGDKLKNYVEKSSKIYDLSLKHFLYTNFESVKELLHKDILKNLFTLSQFAFKTIDKHVSGYVNDRRLKQILEYHMVFLGSSPFQAPAIYSLMSVLDFKSGVFYPKKGMYSLVENLLSIGKNLGVNYHFNSEVNSIVIEEGQIKGIQLKSGKEINADIVVSNADLHFTETKLLPQKYQSFPESYWANRQPGPSALLISLGVKGSLPNLLHHNLFFVDDWQENFSAIYNTQTIPENASIYVCNPTKTDTSTAPKEHENLFILIPLPANIEIDTKLQLELVDRFIEQFEIMSQIPDIKERIITSHIFGPNDFKTEFYSWQAGALGGQSHKLFQSAMFRTPNKSKKVKNLYYVGAGTTPGIGLPMCLIGAQLAYKRIAGIKNNGPIKEISNDIV